MGPLPCSRCQDNPVEPRLSNPSTTGAAACISQIAKRLTPEPRRPCPATSCGAYDPRIHPPLKAEPRRPVWRYAVRSDPSVSGGFLHIGEYLNLRRAQSQIRGGRVKDLPGRYYTVQGSAG